MNKRHLILLSFGILLLSCGPSPEAEPLSSPTASVATAVPTKAAVAEPTTDPKPEATETPAPTLEPTPEPITGSGVAIDPYSLARQLIEQVNPAAPDGWQIEPCQGEAAVLCISDGEENVGYVELLIYPLSGYAEDHSVRLVANKLADNPAVYTAEQETAVLEALTVLAEEHLDIIAADRAITFPDDTSIWLPAEPAQMGCLHSPLASSIPTKQMK